MKRINTKNGLRVAWVLAALGWSATAWGQCATCATTLAGNTNYSAKKGETICILANTTFSGTLNVVQDNVTVCNSGTVSGTINVNAGSAGTVINNFGTFSPGTLSLKAATTLNNGSAAVPAASWGGYIGGSIAVAPTITNYGTWSAQMQPLPGGTIRNQPGATWNAYLNTSANLAITNVGTWNTQVQEGGNSPTISIVHNGGSWTGVLGEGSGSLRLTINAPWTVGFNFPSGAANTLTTAAGTTSTFPGGLGTGGTLAIVNNGTLSLPSGMGTLGSTSSLVNAAGATLDVTGDLYIRGTLANRGTIKVSHDFQNYAGGVVTGAAALPRGTLRVANYTVNAGSFGADGSYLDFCDGTPPTPASNGFDVRGGTVGSNVIFCAANSPLPVTLTSFTAQLRQSQVLVQWATASELNSKEFVVERSADGIAFEALQTVASAGSGATARTYATTDAQPLPGVAYYRLCQVDQDGTRTYSPVVRVRGEGAALAAYPNPAVDALTLDLSARSTSPCTVRLLSLPGQVLLAQTLAGGQSHQLSLAHLPAGTYLLEVASVAQGSSVRRVVKR